MMAQSFINVQRQAPGQDSGADVTMHEGDMSAVWCSTIAVASVRGVLTQEANAVSIKPRLRPVEGIYFCIGL